MATTAKLKIILKADETIVAEIENPVLWQKILSIVSAPEKENEASAEQGLEVPKPKESKAFEDLGQGGDGSDPISSLAVKAQISIAELKAALSPTTKEPYMHIDKRSWAAAKKDTPQRGPGSINSTSLFSTCLCLWFEEAKLGTVKQATVLDMMKKSGISDPNASRNLATAKWVQSRGKEGIFLNPVEIEESYKLFRMFCKKDWKTSATE